MQVETALKKRFLCFLSENRRLRREFRFGGRKKQVSFFPHTSGMETCF
jgi:hypothetical protein